MDKSVPNSSSLSFQQASRLLSFATEILLDIFAHLNGTDLKSLCLSSQRFAEIIGGSDKLLNKLDPIVITESTTYSNDCVLPSVKIYGYGSDKLPDIPENLLHNIQIMSVDCHTLKLMNLRTMLMSCVNLKELTLSIKCSRDFFMDSDSSKLFSATGCPILNLRKLTIDTNCEGLVDMFQRCQIEELQINGKARKFPAEKLKMFLEQRSELKSLQFVDFKSDCGVKSFADMKFQLEKLTFVSCKSNFIAKLGDFMDTQKDTIRKVKITEIIDPAMKLLPRLKNVTTLVLSFKKKPNFGYFFNLPQIENLKVMASSSLGMELFRTFPNVKKVEFEGSFRSMDVTGCKCLQMLHIKATKRVKDLKLPASLRTLIIDAAYCKNHPINFMDSNIEELAIRNAKNLDWLTRMLRSRSKKLTILRINNSIVERKAMERVRKKVEFVEILNCSFREKIWKE